MINTKKLKLDRLNFYIVDDEYVKFLSNFDKHIEHNKNEQRPYVGVVLKIREKYYYAPLSSPKSKHKIYKSNLSFFRMVNQKDKKQLGIIKFSNMIPVPLERIRLLDLKNKAYGYRRLLSEQYSYINITKNKKEIIEKAEKLYDIVTSDKKTKEAKFYKNLSCNFALLEEKCYEYERLTEKQNKDWQFT